MAGLTCSYRFDIIYFSAPQSLILIMKKLYFAFTVLCLAGSSSAQAQISYLASDLPVIGEQITRYRDTIAQYGLGPSGPNQQWSFPAPVIRETFTTSIVSPASTPNPSIFPSSNLAMTNDNVSYLYFSTSANSMLATGTAGDLLQNGSTVEVPFSNPLTVHNLPRNYDDASEDTYYFEAIAYNISVPVGGLPLSVYAARLRHYGHVYDSTDGFGQITTPVGTYDCLRVKSTDHTVDSVWTKLFSFIPTWSLQPSLTGTDTSISYSWIGKESGLALAELSFDTLDNPKNFTWTSVLPLTTGIAATESNEIQVFPQPSTGKFSATWSDNKGFRLAEVFATDGRKVIAMNITNANRLDFDLEALPSGVYLLQPSGADGKNSVVQKVMIE